VEVDMTSTFVSLRRISTLSVAITLVAAPVALAQSSEGAPSSATSANTVLLSPTAFARLAQPPARTAPGPVVEDSPRPSLLREGTAAVAHEARATGAKAPQQKSWASRHKWDIIGWSAVGVGAFFGVWALVYLLNPE
jgi:hypothetical protein